MRGGTRVHLPEPLGLLADPRRPVCGCVRAQGAVQARTGLTGLGLHTHPLRYRLSLCARAARRLRLRVGVRRRWSTSVTLVVFLKALHELWQPARRQWRVVDLPWDFLPG